MTRNWQGPTQIEKLKFRKLIFELWDQLKKVLLNQHINQRVALGRFIGAIDLQQVWQVLLGYLLLQGH